MSADTMDSAASSGGDEARLSCEIREGLAKIAGFTGSVEFDGLLAEMWSLPVDERHRFVADIVLNPAELIRRGIHVPADMKIMRSAFRDDRPTLFCVVRYVPDGFGWSKVTITFDNPAGPPALRYADIADDFAEEAATGSYA